MRKEIHHYSAFIMTDTLAPKIGLVSDWHRIDTSESKADQHNI